ncbi:MAG: hypothetical protein QOJ66_2666, partial [Ilumatobacteraceae bacterium]
SVRSGADHEAVIAGELTRRVIAAMSGVS